MGALLFKEDESRPITVVRTTLIEQVDGRPQAVQNDPFRTESLKVEDVGVLVALASALLIWQETKIALGSVSRPGLASLERRTRIIHTVFFTPFHVLLESCLERDLPVVAQ